MQQKLWLFVFLVIPSIFSIKALGQNQQKHLGLGLNSQQLISRYGEPFNKLNRSFSYQFGANSPTARVHAMMGLVSPQSFFVEGLTPFKEKLCDIEYIFFLKQKYILAFCLFNNKAEEVTVMKAYEGSLENLPPSFPPFWLWEEAEVISFVEKIFPDGKPYHVSLDLLSWNSIESNPTATADGQSTCGLALEIKRSPVVDASLYGSPDWCLKDSKQQVFCFFVNSRDAYSKITPISQVLLVTTTKRSEMVKNRYLKIIKDLNSKTRKDSAEKKQKIHGI